MALCESLAKVEWMSLVNIKERIMRRLKCDLWEKH